MDETLAEHWRKCGTCKKPISFGSPYYACNVSTCNRPRVGFIFCSVTCWDAHLPIMNHRQAWSEEKRAPSRVQWAKMLEEEKEGSSAESTQKGIRSVEQNIEKECLIVASKLKLYIRDKSGGMNTSASVMEVLSDNVRRLCDDAIVRAREDGRKTVLDRDFV